MPRLFVALPLPDRLRTRLAEEADRLRLSGAKVSWIHPDLYHVEVRSLGEVRDEELLHLDPMLAKVIPGIGTLSLVVKGLVGVPDPLAPRAVWSLIEGKNDEESEELFDLKKRIDQGLSKLGYRRAKGLFVPHVNLGQVRDQEGISSLIERMGPATRREFGHFVVKEAVVYQSEVLRSGPTLTPIKTISLA